MQSDLQALIKARDRVVDLVDQGRFGEGFHSVGPNRAETHLLVKVTRDWRGSPAWLQDELGVPTQVEVTDEDFPIMA